VFVWLRLSYQFRCSADPTNDFGVVNIADMEVWLYEDINIVIFVGVCTLLFYVVNMDVVSLFANSSLLFLANLYCIDVFYQFEE